MAAVTKDPEVQRFEIDGVQTDAAFVVLQLPVELGDHQCLQLVEIAQRLLVLFAELEIADGTKLVSDVIVEVLIDCYLECVVELLERLFVVFHLSLVDAYVVVAL